tara:strand:+ start:1340 stop:2845 length:1506 start_codon:yes stop_codon:yes gene_type:complete
MSTNHNLETDDITYPEKFPSLIIDFTQALTVTFPEYSSLWSKYTKETTDMEWLELYQYCLDIYPELFFQILYQNDEFFEISNADKTFMLPNVNFSRLYNMEGVTENTKQSVWKYLQLVLFSVIGSVKESETFGESASMFEGMDEKELHGKLADAMKDIGNFFTTVEETVPKTSDDPEEKMETETETETEMNESFTEFAESFTKEMGNVDEMQNNMNKMFDKIFSNESDNNNNTEKEKEKEKEKEPSFNPENLPDAENIHEHIKGLFGEKLGSLTSELIEELSEDIKDSFGIDFENLNENNATSEIFQTIMKNPSKLKNIMEKIHGKFKDKMDSGDLSQEDIMKETANIFEKMKDMGGGDTKNAKDMFKNLAKTMGGMGGMEGMPGMEQMMNMFGKNARVDTNAIDRMSKMQSTKDRIRAKLAKKKEQQLLEKQKQANFVIENTNNPNHYVYRSLEDGTQMKSFIRPVTDNTTDEELNKLVADIEGTVEVSNKSKKKNKKKK